MASSKSILLSSATHLRPQFRSRPSSRSPVRHTQSTFQEPDPLLSSLTPESTLRALQTTETLSERQRVPNALTKSITEASTSERAFGIRAALAAQKIQEWRKELSQWQWPSRRESSFGMGFVPPGASFGQPPDPEDPYIGSLNESTVLQYERRLEEIKDALDTLGIEEVKDYVLDAHDPSRSRQDSCPEAAAQDRHGYGRMRDFTALITATVIRALPDLANLDALLTLWNVRLTVLRRVPPMLSNLGSAQSSIKSAYATITNLDPDYLFRQSEFETRKATLAGQVSGLGSDIDRMLNVLEGQEDRLPQPWIDEIEKLELDFATWVVKAHRRALQDEWVAQNPPDAPSEDQLNSPDGVGMQEPPNSIGMTFDFPHAQGQTNSNKSIVADPDATPLASKAEEKFVFPTTGQIPRSHSHRKPVALEVPNPGHKREISEISIADSAYSAFSDISKAEIFDATATEVMTSPTISIVDNPFRASRDDLSSILSDRLSRSRTASPEQGQSPEGTQLSPIGSESAIDPKFSNQDVARRRPFLQRASTASMELFNQSQVRRLTLNRSASQDLSSTLNRNGAGTPIQAFWQLVGEDRNLTTSPINEDLVPAPLEVSSTRTAADGPPQGQAEPASYQSVNSGRDSPDSPSLPRKSSRRAKHASDVATTPDAETSVSSTSTSIPTAATKPLGLSAKSPSRMVDESESLESKIQDILTTLPTEIRLETDSEKLDPLSQAPPVASTRSPSPALVLSPAKKDNTSRPMSGSDSDVQIYHLTRQGQTRDVPPAKLFVRLVGERGERVMVRVGGGWADLGEYLREYSLHHGRRNVADGRLEVANFPNGKSPGEIVTGSPPNHPESLSKTSGGFIGTRAETRSSLTRASGSDFTSLPDIEMQKARRRTSDGSARAATGAADNVVWTPPPVPAIPDSYTMYSPTLTSTTDSRGRTSSSTTAVGTPTSSNHFKTTCGDSPSTISSTTTTPSVSTKTTVYSPSIGRHSYTPLGAAGPKLGAKGDPRRASTFGAFSTPEDEAWVEGMVGKARAGSGSPALNSTMTTTTTTTMSTPTSRRVSAIMGDSPLNRRMSALMADSPPSREVSAPAGESPVGSKGSLSPTTSNGKVSPLEQKPRSRMGSLSDVRGIRRVFLRKQSDR